MRISYQSLFCSKQKFWGNIISIFFFENYLHTWRLIPISRALDWCQILSDSSSKFQLARHLSSPGSKFYLAIDTEWSSKTQRKWYQQWLLLHRFCFTLFWCKISKDVLEFLWFDLDHILKIYLLTFLVSIFEQFLKQRIACVSDSWRHLLPSVTRFWRSGDNRLMLP